MSVGYSLPYLLAASPKDAAFLYNLFQNQQKNEKHP